MKRSILLIMLAVCASVASSSNNAWADARSDARTHYQAGQKAYASSDYKGAIKEFSAAQDLAPADLNNYNLALCYDKLGDADNALTYYKQFLDKVPDAPKRSEIEASMARLDSAKKSKADKSAAADKAAADKKAAADAAAKKPSEDIVVAPPVDDKKAPIVVGTPDVAPPPIGAGVGSTGTPSSGLAVTTGDAQLDRVQGINIDQIRDQRIPNMPADQRNAPPMNGQGQQGQQGANPQNPNGQPNGMAAMNGGNGQQNPNGQPLPNDKPNQTASSDTPVYKKWWFWVVVAVGIYVTYEIATSNSNSDTTNARMFDKSKSNAGAGAVSPGGYTLLRF